MNLADVWAGQDDPLPQRGNAELRGNDTARTIMARPSQIIVSRRDPTTGNTIFLSPQIVRIEMIQAIRGSSDFRDNWTDVSKQNVVVMGFKDTPGYPDTNLLRADQFYFDGLMWTIAEFIPTVQGRLLANAEATP